ncbi:hypothetical protein V8E53_004155 [Lactarius tabidus]
MSGDNQVVAEGRARDATSETASSGAEGAPNDEDSEEDKSSDMDNEKGWKNDTDFDKNIVTMLVCRYLYNKCKHERKTSNFQRKWTYQDILINVHCEELDKKAAKMSGSRAGTGAYLSCYKRAVKQIYDNLDEEARMEYCAQAKKWTEQAPPPQQQQQMFEKYGISTLHDFSETMHCQFGARVATLVVYRDCEGEAAVMFHEINGKLGGTSFKSRYKKWANDPMVDTFTSWTAESFGSGEDLNNNKNTNPSIELQKDNQGFPILPRWEVVEQETHSYKRLLIGKFMGDLYWIVLGGKGRVPWSKLQEAPGDYILTKYLLNSVTLTQFHHIRLQDANALLKHWGLRQAAGEIALQFKNIDKTGQGC